MSPPLRALCLTALAALAALAAVGLRPLPASAANGLELVAATRYELLPDEGRVHVTIDASATALTPDDGTLRTVYTGVDLVLQFDAANVAGTAYDVAIPTAASPSDELKITFVEIDFGRAISFGERYDFRVEYDLLDPGDVAGRDLRITRGVAIFPVWAFGTDGAPGSSVEVSVPPGYAATSHFGSPLDEQQAADGGTILRATDIESPVAFLAYVLAERSGAYVESDLAVSVGDVEARFHVEGWEDDAEWTALMQTVLTDGVPALAETIGLPYPIAATLTVREGTLSRLGDYAGFYDPQRRLIMVRYDGDAFVALHEAAHIWFNDTLIDGRWIKEGFASFYAEEAGRRAGLGTVGLEIEPFLEGYAFPLNDWGDPGDDVPGVEEYGYAASNEAARQIAEVAGIDGLQLVWRAARDDEFAYQPADAETPERGEARSAESWQRLLDLLEERTGADFDPIWVEWIVTAEQAALLEERDAARQRYVATVDAADGWDLPRALRLLMGSWQFDDAIERLDDADAVLAERWLIEQRAAELELTPPPDLRSAFEGSSSMASAASEAREELATLDVLAAAEVALTGEPSTLEAIGLIGVDPHARVSAAGDAFEEGDLPDAVAEAEGAVADWDGAEQRGRERVVIVGGSLLAADAMLLAAAFLARRRRGRVVLAPAWPDSPEDRPWTDR